MRYLLVGILYIFANPAVAQTVAVNAGINKPDTEFDVQLASEQFNEIAGKLREENLETGELQQILTRLDRIIDKAEICVKKASRKVKEVEQQIQQYFGEKQNAAKGKDLLYLERQKEKFSQRQSECRLFMIKAKEAVGSWREAMVVRQQEITFTKGKSVWQRGMQLDTDLKKFSRPNFQENMVYQNIGWIVLGGIILCFPVGWIAWYLTGKLQRETVSRKRWFFPIGGIGYLLLVLVAAFQYFPALFADPELIIQISLAIRQSLIIFSVLLLITLFFAWERVQELLKWYGLNARFLYRVALLTALLFLLNLSGKTMLAAWSAPVNSMVFFESILLYLTLLVAFYFSLQFYLMHRLFFGSWLSPSLFVEIYIGVIGLLIFMDAMGYHFLALHIAKLLFAFLLVILLGLIGWRGIQKMYLFIHYSPRVSSSLRRCLGYRSAPPYFEIVLIRWILQFVLILLLLYVFSTLIGEQSYIVKGFLEYFVQGFHLGGYHIVPLQWLIGLIIFSFLIFLSHYLAAKVSQHAQFDKEEETQVALASIINYAGLAVAVIIGLLIAGFSFTSLAIIAGALSVGIGLGLQSIVNNFFSGIILLLEKPIKAGDRISVNGVEGFVKRVRVRSTQITTPAKEDIIVPNSDLITQQVTNFMYSDNVWRVKSTVGVAYGSDVRLVEKVLLEVAYSHPDVVQEEQNKPMVLFCSFGDSALLFELWCLIEDVNAKYRVVSELNFAIDKAFRENQITIAFPQQDVHVYFPEQSSTPSKQ